MFLDHGDRTVKVVATLDVKADGQSAGAKAASASAASIIKTDETREILGHTARRYDFSFNGRNIHFLNCLEPMAVTVLSKI